MNIQDLFNSNYEYDPIIHNFTQNLKFHDSHHVGVFKGQSPPVGEENPRVKIAMKPKDSKSREEAKRTSRYSVRQDRIKEFPPGTLGPRAHWYLMPDKADQLPRRVRNDEQMGPFFDAWFKQQNLIKALKFKARQENEIMDKLRFTTRPSELDDAAISQMNNLMETVEKHANKMNQNSSSENSQ
jgi:hypothetical protein